MSTSMREALEKMVARFSLYLGPNEIHAGQHDKSLIAEARAALSSTEPDGTVSKADICATLCKAHGTAQCAAICMSHSSLHTTDGRCPEAKRVWANKARALFSKFDIRRK